MHAQFKARTVEKEYLAVVRGSKETFGGMSGNIENYLHSRMGNMSVARGTENAPEDKLASTSWELLASSVRSVEFLSRCCVVAQNIDSADRASIARETYAKNRI